MVTSVTDMGTYTKRGGSVPASLEGFGVPLTIELSLDNNNFGKPNNTSAGVAWKNGL